MVVGPVARVKLSVEAEGLASMDWTSKSDPICFLYEVDPATSAKTLIGQTEWIKNTYDPKFSTQLEVEYHFERKQMLVFSIMDVDDASNPTKNAQEIGRVETTMGRVVGSPKGHFESPLIGKGGKDGFGRLHVLAEELKGRDQDTLHVKLKGVELANKDGMFGKSDPYLKFFCLRTDGAVMELHKTEVIKNDLNPVWQKCMLDMDKLCNGGMDTEFKIECWDWDGVSGDDMIGWVHTTVNALMAGVPIQLNDRPGGKTAKPGALAVESIHITRMPTWLDYIMEGCEVTLNVAVDFTASNGDPKDPSSLHAVIDGGGLNQYQQAMKAVGEIVVEYDKDRKVGALGFGAKLPTGQTSHNFALSGSPSQVEVDGLAGLLEAYKGALDVVTLYGPTNFEPVIRHIADIAKECRKRAYHVLLILTDGDITDKQQTITALVEASELPLSVIIVGVGDEDFEDMAILDGDDGGLVDENGKRAKHDIVQFVAFKKCRNAELLAAEVLAELPAQLLGYMATQNKTPECWKGTPYRLPEGYAWFRTHQK